jgi:biopolymer transport protein ExbD
MKSQIRAEINVTPLVDVCLVLLIIFLVVTPLIHADDVELPEAPFPRPWPAEPARSRVTLSYGPPIAISVDDDPGPLSQAAFEELLRAIRARHVRHDIVLRADRRLSYGEVKRALRTIQTAGFPAVGLVAERPSRAPRP